MRPADKKKGLVMAFDAEATDMDRGLPIQIAYIVADRTTGTVVKEVDSLVAVPRGAVVNPCATRIHGISTERAGREGRPLETVLREFVDDARDCDVIVAHNARADRDLLVRACATVGVRMGDVPWQCTQVLCTAPCALPAPWLPTTLKPPRLREAHALLVAQPAPQFDRPHNARSDALLCLQLWFTLTRRCCLGTGPAAT